MSITLITFYNCFKQIKRCRLHQSIHAAFIAINELAYLIAKLDEMMQPNPEAQQMQQMQQQLAMQAAQANIAVQTTQAEQNRAEAQKLSVEDDLLCWCR